MHFRTIYTQTFLAFILALFALFTSHLFLLFRYPNDFLNLTTSETILSLLMAIRVDTITLLTLSGIAILILTFPIKGVLNLRFRTIIGTLWGLSIISIVSFAYSNVLYFDFSHRHLSNELFSLSNDTNIIIDMALHSFLPYTVAAVLALFAFSYLYFKIFSSPITERALGKKDIFIYLLIIVLIFLGIRSKLSGKGFGVSDAFVSSKVSSGVLALNGVYTVYRTLGDTHHLHQLMPIAKAIPIAQKLLTTPHAPFIDANFPLMRAYNKAKKTNYNVVIVLLESWGAEHIDGFTRYPELNITPYFKELASQSLKFTNFYANGFRSIYGITSIFTGITLPKGFEFLGNGLELSKLSYLGNMAKQNGYSTIAMQGSQRRSYRVDAVSNLAGFEQYYGAQDMPNVEHVEGDRHVITGTYDFNMLDFYHHKLNTMKEPFLGFAFTSTNHSDFHLPSAKFERYPHGLRDYNGQLNAYIYVDDAIRRFMEGVKKEPWFDNTIFIFTSDHGSGDALNPIGKKLRGKEVKPLPSKEHFRIPLIIYAPKIFQAKEINTLGSQVDIFPTIIDILGFKGNFTTMSNSLFDKGVQERFVYYYGGSTIGLIKEDGYLQYNFKNIVDASQKDYSAMQEDLFAIDTAEAHLIKTNKWTK